MSRRYRRNGTPIGKYRVYALAIRAQRPSQVYEIIPSGIETYEELDMLVEMEEMTGRFGHDYDRLVLTKPGLDMTADLTGADLTGADLRDSFIGRSYMKNVVLNGANLSGANLRYAYLLGAKLVGAELGGAELSDAYYPTGEVPQGWSRDEGGFLRKIRRR
jgi:hypothetical protein